MLTRSNNPKDYTYNNDTEIKIMNRVQSLLQRINLTKLKISLPIVITSILINTPGHANNIPGYWIFSSDTKYCKLKTDMLLDTGDASSKKTVTITMLYLNHFQNALQCGNTLLPSNEFIVRVSPRFNGVFNAGSHATFQSETLLNEQATLIEPGPQCNLISNYAPDYRVTNLLISALKNKEKIKLSTDLKSYGQMTGVIPIDDFEVNHNKFTECINNLQN